jgi:hypothetical protein
MKLYSPMEESKWTSALVDCSQAMHPIRVAFSHALLKYFNFMIACKNIQNLKKTIMKISLFENITKNK